MNILIKILVLTLLVPLVNTGFFIFGLYFTRLITKFKLRKSLVFAILFLLLGLDNIVLRSLGDLGALGLIFNSVFSLLVTLLGTRMCLIGLTGGIACGKSTVSDTLASKHKYEIIDCDKIAHD